MEWKNFLSIYCLPRRLTPLSPIHFTTEEIAGCTNEAAKGANKAPRNPPFCFFISSSTVSVTSSINTPKSCIGFKIFILSFKSSFEINKVNPFPALSAYFSVKSIYCT